MMMWQAKLLALLFLTTNLPATQQSSSDKELFLKCNQTVTVQEGDSVTLNCVLHYPKHMDCNVVGIYLRWNNTGNLRNHTFQITFKRNNATGLSITINNVTQRGICTVKANSNCGMDEQCDVEVNFLNQERILPPEPQNPGINFNTVGVPLTVLFIVIIILLFRTKRGKEIRRCNKGKEGNRVQISPELEKIQCSSN